VVRQAVDALGVRGTCGIVGAAPPGSEIRIDVTEFMQMAKILYGIIEGDAVPDTLHTSAHRSVPAGTLSVRKTYKDIPVRKH
jgi:Zn-dependent alcohol dehydrogenase